MIIMKLDYIFAPFLVFFFCLLFVLSETQLKILISIYLLGHFCWINSSSFK